ncbi:radial spoke head 1 homolog isoform X3 [Rhopilema esculentum]|uniref:radial spoke head 1 homolog isoform X3 n=1 Tax=Rhopilema esculentum TaxID=499914 RepID=UPI0031D7E3A1
MAQQQQLHFDTFSIWLSEFVVGQWSWYARRLTRCSLDWYFGDYKDGKRDGNGVMIYPDGSKYSGAWKNGLKNGKGTYTFVNGDEFDGEWQNDLKHGRGRYCYKETGTEFLAKWVEGQQVGTARWVHKDHEYEGHFKEGSPCGRGKYSFRTGCELQGYYVIKDIVRQVDKRMELVGREPIWHAQLLSHSMASKEV